MSRRKVFAGYALFLVLFIAIISTKLLIPSPQVVAHHIHGEEHQQEQTIILNQEVEADNF